MSNQTRKTWTADQLVRFSNALGNSYIPGINGSNAAGDDRWTTKRHIQASMLRGQAYL